MTRVLSQIFSRILRPKQGDGKFCGLEPGKGPAKGPDKRSGKGSGLFRARQLFAGGQAATNASGLALQPVQSASHGHRLGKRFAPGLAFFLALCILVVCCHDSGYTALPPIEKRYASAKAGFASLKQNERKKHSRDEWQDLITEFRAIYDSGSNWPNRPAALFRLAESQEELARITCARTDARNAVRSFEQLASSHSGSRLADDALFRAAKLRASWLRDERGALALLARIRKQYPRGDILAEAIALENVIKASASGKTSPDVRKLAAASGMDVVEDMAVSGVIANSARAGRQDKGGQEMAERFRKAKAGMEAMRGDKVRYCQREPWQKLQAEFLAIYRQRKNSPLAPASLYRVAACQESLAVCSRQPSDFRLACKYYEQVASEFRQSGLADDALLRAARIQAENLGQKAVAKKILDRLFARHPAGDKVAEAKALMAGWDGGKDAGSSDSGKAAKNGNMPELQVLSWDSPNKNSVEIVLELSGPSRYNARLVEAGKGQPARLVLDLENAGVVNDVRRGVTISGSLLQAIQVQDRKGGGSSLQFDFREVRRFDTRVEKDPCRIILSVAAGKAALPGKAAATRAFAESMRNAPQPQFGQVASVIDDVAEPPVPAKAKSRQRSVLAGRTVSDMASQLGLTVGTVFIDPGHGGRDPGTGHNGIVERNISLDVALTLGRLLTANGLEVVYSRNRDTSLKLSERTRKANRTRADLFVSIHVNASESSSANGIETYYLDLASNTQAARVAALENAGSDRRLGDMQNMLADVMLNAKVDESRRLASDIQRLAIHRLKRRDYQTRSNGVKSAPFHVLIGAQMPAVLVEIGYCTNREEAANLADPKYRKALAEGLAEGILAYKDRLLRRHTAQNSLTLDNSGAM